MTELLKGKRAEAPQPKTPEQVEALLDRTIHIVKEKKQRIAIFAVALAIVMIEWGIMRGIRWPDLNVLEGLATGLEWTVLRVAVMLIFLGSLVFALYKTGKKYE